MKKLFFLFAASALLVACSSDDQADLQGGNPVTDPTEATVSVATVDYENGVQIAVGDLDGSATRASEDENINPEGHLNFCIDLNKLAEEAKDVLGEFENYKLLVDDMAIRQNGEYVNVVSSSNNKINRWSVYMEEKNLKVAVRNIETLAFDIYDDMTFECYLWIENKKLLNDGTGGYGELFTDQDKFDWIGFDNAKAEINYYKDLPEDAETGVDLSKSIWDATTCGAATCQGEEFFEPNAKSEYTGYVVRYNVYRGLQGLNGDTPYVKVSVHIAKPEQTTVGDKGNQATYVDYGSENKQ